LGNEGKRCEKVVIMAFGSRGDAQPYIALAIAMESAGYDVTMFLPKDQLAFAEACGAKARSVFMDVGYEMTQGKLKIAMETGDMMGFTAALADCHKKHAVETAQALKEAMEETKPDAVIAGTLTGCFAMLVERHYKVPVMLAMLSAIPAHPPTMTLGLPNLCCLNGYLVRYLLRDMAGGELNNHVGEFKKWGIDHSKLFTVNEAMDRFLRPTSVTRHVLGCDPLIGAYLFGGEAMVPKDLKMVGFWAVDSERQVDAVKGEQKITKKDSNKFGEASEMDAMEVFIAAKEEPPVYLGFGSMLARSPEHMVELLCDGVRQAKVRAIISKGWAKLSMELLVKSTKDASLIEYAKENIFFAGNTPHEWLFPKCSLTVHHGGAGTMNTAAKAGIPQVIIPVWVDQWDHTRFLNAYGAGVGLTKQLTKVNAKEIGDAIRKALGDSKIKAKAKEWGEKTRALNGTQAFMDEFHSWWDKEVATGNYAKYVEEGLKKFKK